MVKSTAGTGLTIRSSRDRFAASCKFLQVSLAQGRKAVRLNSGVSCHQMITQDFEEQRSRHFDTLCRNLELTPKILDQLVLAESGHIRVYFEDDRGLCSFAIGSVNDVRPLCAVDEIAERFPRLRLLGGQLRLSLLEQQLFLESNWPLLQAMFSPEQIAETREWRQAMVEKYTRRFTAGS